MPRLKPGIARDVKSIKPYIGKALIFCEGTTEYNYLEYFMNIFNVNEMSKYTNINLELQVENVSGNAQTVYTYAEDFLSEEENSKKYKDYDKYLIFDCDDPENIQETIKNMIDSSNKYKLLLTNKVFEIWLLMHFEIVDKELTKCQAYKKMALYLGCVDYNSKEKAKKGNIRKIIGDGENIKQAINNAKNIENENRDKCDNLSENINVLNPYTKVHLFIEKVLCEIDNMNEAINR
ncbi:RloB family protein [Clostridium perfringens]